MMRWIGRYLFGSVPVVFKSPLPLDECVRRLREKSKRSTFSSSTQAAAVGRVDRDGVRLQWAKPWFGNSFKPTFVGRFEADLRGTRLKGQFTMHLSTKILMSIGLGFAILWTLTATIMALVAAEILLRQKESDIVEPTLLLFPLFGLAMLVLCIGLMKSGWHLSRRDIVHLSQVIEKALDDV